MIEDIVCLTWRVKNHHGEYLPLGKWQVHPFISNGTINCLPMYWNNLRWNILISFSASQKKSPALTFKWGHGFSVFKVEITIFIRAQIVNFKSISFQTKRVYFMPASNGWKKAQSMAVLTKVMVAQYLWGSISSGQTLKNWAEITLWRVRALLQWVKPPVWKVGDRGFISHSGIQVPKKQMFLPPLTRKEPPWPRGSVLALRRQGLKFRILCLDGSVISFISPSSGCSPDQFSTYVHKLPKTPFINLLHLNTTHQANIVPVFVMAIWLLSMSNYMQDNQWIIWSISIGARYIFKPLIWCRDSHVHY